MSRIRGKDTTSEKAVRSMLHRMGYRFRLNVKIPIELRKQEGRKSYRGLFGLWTKTHPGLVGDSAVRMNGHGHNVLLNSNGVFVFTFPIQELLKMD